MTKFEVQRNAYFRKLSKLLLKRAKLLDRIKAIMTKEAILDLECHCYIEELFNLE